MSIEEKDSAELIQREAQQAAFVAVAAAVPEAPAAAAQEESGLPLPERLCFSSDPTRQESATKEPEEQSYDEKKRFWERMSSSESGSSLPATPDQDVKKPPPPLQPVPTMSGIPEERAKVGSEQLVLQSAVPQELSDEEILQQISPEKKGHFDTFVAPSLEADDDADLEKKQIPLSKEEKVPVDKERMMTMQIKEEILDTELKHHEESVMTSESLLQESQEIQPVPCEQASFSRVVYVTAPSVEEESKSQSPSDLAEAAPLVQENGAVMKEETPRKNSLLTSDPVAGEVEIEEFTQTRRLSREEATELAQGLLTELESKAMEQVKVLRLSQEQLVDQPEADVRATGDIHGNLTHAAQSFVEDLEKKAVEIVERISHSGSSREDLLQEDTYDRVEKQVPIQFSTEISDSDLKLTDISALKDEYDQVRESTSSGSPSTVTAVHPEEISDGDLKAEVDTSHLELHQQLSDMMEESKHRTTFHEMKYMSPTAMGAVPAHFRYRSSFRCHFVSWFVHGENHLADGSLAPGQRRTAGTSQGSETVTGPDQVDGRPTHHHTGAEEFSAGGGGKRDSASEDIWAEEARLVRKDLSFMREKKSDNESSSSTSRARTADHQRRSGTDFEVSGWSSSGENYVTAGEATGTSRPSSSDVEAMYSAKSGRSSTLTTTTTAEYETAQSSRDVSTHSNVTLTSGEYHTAVSSLTSKESLKSLDTSESSGHLGSIEISEGHTECDDSLLDAALVDRDMITPTGPLSEERCPDQISPHIPGALLLQETSDTDDHTVSPEITPHMKRSHEMMFQQENTAPEEPLNPLSGSVLTISSASESTVVVPSVRTDPAEGQAKTDDQNNRGQLPRVVSFETTVSYDTRELSDLRDQRSFDSEFGSRPESELKILESRPQSLSEAMLSRSSSEDGRPASKEDLSDSEVPHLLKTCHDEPFERPVSPEPPRESRTSTLSENLEVTKQFAEVSEEAFDSQECEILPDVEILHATNKKDIQGAAGTDDMTTEEPAIVTSPPLISKQIGVQFWPPKDQSQSQDSQEAEAAKTAAAAGAEKEIEEKKQWLESQFDGSQAVVQEHSEEFFYTQPLGQIVEEDEGGDNERELQKLKQSLSQAGEFSSKKLWLRNEKDDISMSSLQEFEKLEKELAGRRSRGSTGSQDSLEAGPIKPQKKVISKGGDDMSVDSSVSLVEFERLEHACKEAVHIEKLAKEQEEVLSEIEEGHESQISEATDSGETLSETGGAASDEDDNSDDFEERMFQIDEIIKQAQSNVEQFHQAEELKPVRGGKAEMLPLGEILAGGKPESGTESSRVDHTESPVSPDSDSLEAPPPQQMVGDLMETSADSLDLNQKVRKNNNGVMQTSVDSLEGGNHAEQANLMEESTDSLEGKRHNGKVKKVQSQTEMMTSTDSLEDSSNRDRVDVTHSQVSVGHSVTEVLRGDQEEDGLGRVVQRTVQLPASLSRVKFSGPNADRKMKEYLEQFRDTGRQVQETEYVDGRGNLISKKVIETEPRLSSTIEVIAERRKEKGVGDPTLEEMFRAGRGGGEREAVTDSSCAAAAVAASASAAAAAAAAAGRTALASDTATVNRRVTGISWM